MRETLAAFLESTGGPERADFALPADLPDALREQLRALGYID